MELILVACFWRLDLLTVITLATDEMGVLAVSVFPTGLDWRSYLSTVSYYGFGYSFLITPLSLLFREPVALYRAICVFNSLLLSFTVPVSYMFMKKLAPKLDSRLICLASFVIAAYSANLMRVQMAMGETLLVLLFWLLC